MSERKASLAVVYFGVGFTLAAAWTMLLLMLFHPLIMEDGSPGVIRASMFAPLVIGAGFGARVAIIGLRRNLRLGKALLRALVPWETGL